MAEYMLFVEGIGHQDYLHPSLGGGQESGEMEPQSQEVKQFFIFEK